MKGNVFFSINFLLVISYALNICLIHKLLFTAINSKKYSKYYGYGRNMYIGALFYHFWDSSLVQGNWVWIFWGVQMSADFHFLWNSNLMIPDFPIDIRIRLAELIFFLLLLLLPDFANFLPCWPAQFC